MHSGHSMLRSLRRCRLFEVGVSVVLIAAAWGCGCSVEVLRQTEPNPLVQQTRFHVSPIRFVSLEVDGQPESVHEASLEGDQVPKWREDKQAIDELFRSTLAAEAEDEGIELVSGGASAPFRLEATVSHIETGYYRIPAWSAVTVVELTLRILDSYGTVVDEILVEDSAAFDVILNPSTGGRLRSVAKVLGDKSACYLASRVHP